MNTIIDAVDDNPGNGVCSIAGNNGACSLRAAIQEANARSGPDFIVLASTVYTITLNGALENQAVSGDLDITDDLTLTGSGNRLSIIDGNKLDRILDIRNSAAVIINNISLRNGLIQQNGGGILVDENASLTLTNCNITDNESWSDGGGIAMESGELTVENCNLKENISAGFGGAINLRLNTTASISSSTINNNTSGFGGGISSTGKNTVINSSLISGNRSYNAGAITTGATGSKLFLINSTVSSNHSDVSAAAIYMFGGSIIYVRNSTIAVNEAAKHVGGIISSGLFYVQNSIIALNKSPNTARVDCLGTLVSQGYNLIGNNSGCNIAGNVGDQIGTGVLPINPLLAPLADNGGQTLSHALLPDSPALDVGNPLQPGSGGTSCELTDQRGTFRLKRGVCDIGAFEATGGGDAWIHLENDAEITPGYELIKQNIIVGNKGPNKVGNVTLTFNVPEGSRNLEIAGEDWLCVPGVNSSQCNRLSLSSQTELQLSMQFVPPADSKEIISEVSVTTLSDDPISSNNQSKITTVINLPPVVAARAGRLKNSSNNSVLIAREVLITDEDDTYLAGATIQFTQGYQPGEDFVRWGGSARISAQWQPESASLLLQGEDTIGAYIQALQEVYYESTRVKSDAGQRSFRIVVRDQYADSLPAMITLSYDDAGASTPASDIPAEAENSNPYAALEADSQSDNSRHEISADQRKEFLVAWFKFGDKKAHGSEDEINTLNQALVDQLAGGVLDNNLIWLTKDNLLNQQRHALSQAAVIGATVLFVAGFISLYIRTGAFFGFLFSFPLWVSVDPVNVLMLSASERARRKRDMQKQRQLENMKDRVGGYFEK